MQGWRFRSRSLLFLQILSGERKDGGGVNEALLDYTAVMGLFVCIGHYFTELLKTFRVGERG